MLAGTRAETRKLVMATTNSCSDVHSEEIPSVEVPKDPSNNSKSGQTSKSNSLRERAADIAKKVGQDAKKSKTKTVVRDASYLSDEEAPTSREEISREKRDNQDGVSPLPPERNEPSGKNSNNPKGKSSKGSKSKSSSNGQTSSKGNSGRDFQSPGPSHAAGNAWNQADVVGKILHDQSKNFGGSDATESFWGYTRPISPMREIPIVRETGMSNELLGALREI